MRKVKFKNLDRMARMINVPGLREAVHLGPMGRPGDTSDAVELPTGEAGPEAEHLKGKRKLAILDVQ